MIVVERRAIEARGLAAGRLAVDQQWANRLYQPAGLRLDPRKKPDSVFG